MRDWHRNPSYSENLLNDAACFLDIRFVLAMPLHALFMEQIIFGMEVIQYFHSSGLEIGHVTIFTKYSKQVVHIY